jgi:methionyl-tRNA formyltransferase
MGSGTFAVPSLEAILESEHELLGLVTQPDKPAGRGHRVRMPPTKTLLLDRASSLPIHQPVKLRAEDSVQWVADLSPELIVVVAYGQIVPKSVLDIPPRGIINVHGSILPAYRGAAPIQWAIANGESRTGVTTMLMDEGLDTGPVLQTRIVDIAHDDTAETLGSKLAVEGAGLLLETMKRWEAGELEPMPQDDRAVTHAARIRKEDAKVDWSWPATKIANRVRAFVPWPVVFAPIGSEMVRIWRAAAVDGDASDDPALGRPGTFVSVASESVLVRCGEGTLLRLDELQPPGKPRMSAGAFARGRRIGPGGTL